MVAAERARTVAIAGAGIAGFAAAAAFAHHGWKVTVFERTESPREFGAGIYLKENSLPVLDTLGISERLFQSGVRLRELQIVDEWQEVIVRREVPNERVLVVLRAELHRALQDCAEALGVELVTNAPVTAARPDGHLVLEGGREVKADVVIGADGFHSRVRDTLGLAQVVMTLGDGATRLVIPRQEEPISVEYWSGRRRVGIAPCSAELSYVFIIGPESDERAVRLPVDKDYWIAALPHLAHVFDRISDDQGVHHAHPFVRCHRWVAGRAAIIGDAAHAQPPNLGQGAGLAIAAAWRLARTLSESVDIEAGLRRWEAIERPIVDGVQRVTTAYDVAGYLWPPVVAPARAALFRFLSQWGPTQRRWEWWWRGGCARPQAAAELEVTPR